MCIPSPGFVLHLGCDVILHSGPAVSSQVESWLRLAEKGVRLESGSSTHSFQSAERVVPGLTWCEVYVYRF